MSASRSPILTVEEANRAAEVASILVARWHPGNIDFYDADDVFGFYQLIIPTRKLRSLPSDLEVSLADVKNRMASCSARRVLAAYYHMKWESSKKAQNMLMHNGNKGYRAYRLGVVSENPHHPEVGPADEKTSLIEYAKPHLTL